MSFYNYFKDLFGFSGNRYTNDNEEKNDFTSQFFNPNHGNEDSWGPIQRPPNERDSNNIQQFNMFTDPLEMHRYFEQQINEIIKSFGMFGNEDSSTFGGLGPGQNLPQIESPSSNLREHFLKPGYEATKNGTASADSDLDGKVNVNDLDSLIKNGPSNDKSVVPKQDTFLPKIRSFGQSMSTKTIRTPDGTIETHRTVRDSAGNEETTITRQMGDKQYTVTVRTDKHGRQEKVEDMINIDEKELSRFTDKWKQPESPQTGMTSDLNDWFEKMFIK